MHEYMGVYAGRGVQVYGEAVQEGTTWGPYGGIIHHDNERAEKSGRVWEVKTAPKKYLFPRTFAQKSNRE